MSPLVLLTLILFAGTLVTVLLVWSLFAPRRPLMPTVKPRPRDVVPERSPRTAASNPRPTPAVATAKRIDAETLASEPVPAASPSPRKQAVEDPFERFVNSTQDHY